MTLSLLAHYLLLPPINLLCLALAGLALRRKRPRLGKTMSYGALLLLLALSTRFVANLLLAPLEDSTAPFDAKAARGAQAIVILAAGTVQQAPEYGGEDVPDALALARLRYGARLQHETGLPILVTGGRLEPEKEPLSYAAGMAEALRKDFRTDVAWLEEASTTTAENASMSAAILLPAGKKRIVLVTHAMHMGRAALVFRAAGFEVIPAPTAFYSHMPFHPRQLLPSANGLSASYYAVYEWIGLAWYQVRLYAGRLGATASAASSASLRSRISMGLVI